MPSEYFHVDPVNLVVVIAGIIVMWTTLRNDSKWHSSWIKKHDKECDEQRAANNTILTKLTVTNEHLSTLSEGQTKRLDFIDEEIVRMRERTHDIADSLQASQPIPIARGTVRRKSK